MTTAATIHDCAKLARARAEVARETRKTFKPGSTEEALQLGAAAALDALAHTIDVLEANQQESAHDAAEAKEAAELRTDQSAAVPEPVLPVEGRGADRPPSAAVHGVRQEVASRQGARKAFCEVIEMLRMHSPAAKLMVPKVKKLWREFDGGKT